MFWKAFTHEIMQVPLNYGGRQKVMLCAYTDNIHEDGDDDRQHNSAVHIIKEVPTSSYQAKY
jgi:hypothetical protein